MLLTLGWMLLAGLPTPPPHHPLPPAARPASAAGRVTLWTDRDDPYPRGSGARVYLSVDEPSYISVFRVDTDGRIRVLFPREPWGDNYVEDRQTLEVTGVRDGSAFVVDDYPGIGYLFAVASPEPLDFRQITRGDYWDYRSIGGGRVQGDPYVSLTEIAARMAPDEDYDYDVVPYYVERHYDYPRFVCYDCHAYASYSEWDPYRTSCTRFRVVVRDDPRYYPYRYGGGRNVVPDRSLHPGPRYLFREADPASAYVTRVPGRVEPGRRRNLADDDRGATSDDVGGRGTIPTPGLSSLRRPGRTETRPELSPARPLIEERRRAEERRRDADSAGRTVPEGLKPAPAPTSTGEPELRRRRP
ncbi:MAG: DUF4384 domain-containing protein [Gemmatimonadales bacterium]